jgi:hypothetical protein
MRRCSPCSATHPICMAVWIELKYQVVSEHFVHGTIVPEASRIENRSNSGDTCVTITGRAWPSICVDSSAMANFTRPVCKENSGKSLFRIILR